MSQHFDTLIDNRMLSNRAEVAASQQQRNCEQSTKARATERVRGYKNGYTVDTFVSSYFFAC